MIRAVSQRTLLACCACLALGILGGASGAVVLLGQEVDRLTLDVAALLDEIERLTSRITVLDAYGPTGGDHVETIEIIARGVERARPAIEQSLKSLLTHLFGEELNRVHAATVHQVLERTLTVDRQEYEVQVRYVYVTPTLRAYVDVRPLGEPDLIE